MKYANLLKKYIKQSRFTLDEISERIEKEGLTASKQYLSKLQNGKTPPASEKMNDILAKITNGDKRKLNWYAYVEKAPQTAKVILDSFSEDDLEVLFKLEDKFPEEKNITLLESDNNDIKNTDEYKYLNNKIKEATINEYFNGDVEELNQNSYTLLKEQFGDIVDKEFGKEKILAMIKNYGLMLTAYAIDNKKHPNKYRTDSFKNQIDESDYLKVPLLGSISAGKPVLAEENIESYEIIPNTHGYDIDEIFMLRVTGDSMIGSRIYEGDKVLVKMQPDVESGEIAVVNVDSDEATLKKVKKLENGQTLLIPSNDKYEPILIENENARIIGKVIQVIFEP